MKNLIKSFVLMCCMTCAAFSAQRVIILTAGDGNPDLTSINQMLAKGWRVVNVTAAGAGTESIVFRKFTYVFVLESPTPTPKS